MRPPPFFSALLFVLGSSPLVSCRGPEQAAASSEVLMDFPVAKPRVEDVTLDREFVSEVRAVKYAELRARLGGVLDSVAVDEGQAVQAGQLLFQIHALDLSHELAAARAATTGADADLQAARLEFENARLLQEKRVISGAEVGLAEARVKALEAKREEWKATAGRAQVSLGYSRILAPFAGTVNRIPNKAGSAIGAETLLTTLADTTEIHAYFRLSEREYFERRDQLEKREGSVRLRLVDGSFFPGEGVVDAIENEVDRETGTVGVRVRFKNEKGLLKHGSSALVVLRADHKQALLIPQKSTFEIQGDLFVFTVGPEGVVSSRRITTKGRASESFLIGSGLLPDDWFVVEGAQRLRDGVKIRPRTEAEKSEG